MPKETTTAAQTRLPNIAARLFEEPLLIHPRKLNTVINVLAPRLFENIELTADMEIAARDPFLTEHPPQITPGYRTIGVIPVHGTLVQRGDCLDAASGLRSYESIREDFDEALESSEIDAILFDIDSGGGEAAGVFDLADYIAANRGEKPIYAFANEHAYSAAYAIACAADKIYLPRIGGVGSIGVVAVHLDQSRFDEKAGLNYTPIFAGARKIDGWPHAPLSKDALSRMQKRVDIVYKIFTQTVAANRGIPESKILQTEADCFDGSEAVENGLADGLASFDELIEIIHADIQQKAAQPVSGPTARESTAGQPGKPQPKPKKGNNAMGLKNLVLRNSRRAAQMEEMPDEEDETLDDPIEEEEAEEDQEDENLEDESEEENADESEEDESLEEDEDEEDLEEDEEKEAAFNAGRKEAMEILSLCKLYGKPALAETYLRKGYSASQVRKKLLAKRNAALKASSKSNVISNRQSAKAHSGQGGVVAAVKTKLGKKE